MNIRSRIGHLFKERQKYDTFEYPNYLKFSIHTHKFCSEILYCLQRRKKVTRGLVLEIVFISIRSFSS